MKTVLLVVFLVSSALLVLYLVLLSRTASAITKVERMLEDEDQIKYLMGWFEEKHSRKNTGYMSRTVLRGIVHSVEYLRIGANRRGYFRPKERYMGCPPQGRNTTHQTGDTRDIRNTKAAECTKGEDHEVQSSDR